MNDLGTLPGQLNANLIVLVEYSDGPKAHLMFFGLPGLHSNSGGNGGGYFYDKGV